MRVESILVLWGLLSCTACFSPRADFTFINGAEPQTLDPAIATGVPEGRIIRALFEGLTTRHPETLAPLPGMAESWDVSDDNLVYTFRIREDARWSNDEPFTAHDFVYSWRRALTPETAAQYSYQLWYIRNAEKFNAGEIFDFSDVGVRALDDHTLEVTLENPTPYFVSLTSFYTLFPVHRESVERWGDEWIKPEHIVTNGPFLLKRWRLRHEIYLVKNPRYWDAENVAFRSVRVLPSENANTAFNLYEKGTADWHGSMPAHLTDLLLERPDVHVAPYLGTYFVRVNVTRPPLDDPRVRLALFMSVRREDIVRYITRGGEVPAYTFTPPMHGYEPPEAPGYDPEEARRLLAEAGYPGGRGLRKLVYLYNTLEGHRDIAEVLQQQWKESLGVDIELLNQEWKVYLNSQRNLEYDLSRSGWIGDYVDPNTFLDMFVTGGGNNATGWSNEEYDTLIARAARTDDHAERMRAFRRAEHILVADGPPVIPLYYYVVRWMYPPYVRGATPNLLGELFLKNIWIDEEGV
jgi:oligopeptide transport system substrate-binding protein